MTKILEKLLTPRSIIALSVTYVFANLSITGKLNTESVMMIFMLIFGYWFGREEGKKSQNIQTDKQTGG